MIRVRFCGGIEHGKSARSKLRNTGLCSGGTEPPGDFDQARDLNFTNEGGVCGTTRLAENIGGLWLLQSCRRSWASSGQEFSYEDLMKAAEDDVFHSARFSTRMTKHSFIPRI